MREFYQLGATAGNWNVIRHAVATISDSHWIALQTLDRPGDTRLGVFPERGRCLLPNSPRTSLWRRAWLVKRLG